jgi:hypothetical protein
MNKLTKVDSMQAVDSIQAEVAVVEGIQTWGVVDSILHCWVVDMTWLFKEKKREKKSKRESCKTEKSIYYPFQGKFDLFQPPPLNHLPIVSWQEVLLQLRTCIPSVLYHSSYKVAHNLGD